MGIARRATSSGNGIATYAIIIESYLFPLLFLYFACLKAIPVLGNSRLVYLTLINIGKESTIVKDLTFLAGYCTELILLLFNLLLMCSLIVRRNLYQKPENLIEIVLPIVSTFLCLSFNYWGKILTPIHNPWAPRACQQYLFLGGALLALVGWALSLLATYQLRFSYGIFIQVRDIVTRGVYKYSRHPVYFGYILFVIGLSIMNPYYDYLVLLVLFITIIIKRALMEENKLKRHSPAYLEYIEKTPFLFPVKF